jgi:hypothetical protein
LVAGISQFFSITRFHEKQPGKKYYISVLQERDLANNGKRAGKTQNGVGCDYVVLDGEKKNGKNSININD